MGALLPCRTSEMCFLGHHQCSGPLESHPAGSALGSAQKSLTSPVRKENIVSKERSQVPSALLPRPAPVPLAGPVPTSPAAPLRLRSM